MAHLASVYIKKEILEQLAKTTEKGITVTVSVNDEENEHGQNVKIYYGQTKEQIAAKKPKYYIGNGKVYWTNGEPPFIPSAVKPAAAEKPKETGGLPWE